MNKAVVIYDSKYGFTKRYASWIAETLCCPIFERKHFHARNFRKYELIIYGGGLYAGGMRGLKLIAGKPHYLRNKKLIVFTCGLADPTNPENVSHIQKNLVNALSPEITEELSLFHLRGGIDYSRLSPVHKCMMSMLRRMLLKKNPETLGDEERTLLKTYGTTLDFTERASIVPLIEYALDQLKNLNEN